MAREHSFWWNEQLFYRNTHSGSFLKTNALSSPLDSQTELERVLHINYTIQEKTDCWLWTGQYIILSQRPRFGPGKLHSKFPTASPERLLWQLHHNTSLPPYCHLRHSCETGRFWDQHPTQRPDLYYCVNPEHLTLLKRADDTRPK